MAASSNDSGGPGCFGWFIGLAIAFAIVVYSVSGLGHLLGLTPTGGEVLDQDGEWLAKRYEGVVVGYVLTVLIIALPVAAYFLHRWSQANQTSEEYSQAMKGIAGLAALLLALAVVLPVGPRDEPLGGFDGGSLSESGDDAAEEAAEERREEALDARRERRAEQRAEARRERLREQRQKQQEKRQEAAAAAAAVEEPEPEPVTGTTCEAGYDPCVPLYPPDLDCDDVGGPISVSGSDPHGFDADGDGQGCE